VEFSGGLFGTRGNKDVNFVRVDSTLAGVVNQSLA
jgi:hypothetical protein